jgi:hypothetical protein
MQQTKTINPVKSSLSTEGDIKEFKIRLTNKIDKLLDHLGQLLGL